MKIRNKILVYFSTTVIALTALSFILIYLLFSQYRKEEFLQQQSERIGTSLQLLSEIKQDNENIQETMDVLTVYDFYDEKLLIFNELKELIYSSKEDIPAPDIKNVLKKLSPENKWFRAKEGKYDIIGIYVQVKNKSYYAISKAYDDFGYTKMFFLRNVLIGIFVIIAIIVFLISHFLSKNISKPIADLTERLNKYDLSAEDAEMVQTETTTFEILQLTERFNALLKRTKKAFAFQRHTTQHISHQLKTPVAVLVSELERIGALNDIDAMKNQIHHQLVKAKSLGSIINVLLEISKIESGQPIQKQPVRIDELIYDVIDELNIIYPDFHFEINYMPDIIDESKLIINLNPILIRQAFQNLLNNCILYSNEAKAQITMDCTSETLLKIQIKNTGKPISEDEKKYLFKHFFRGQNSHGVTGFGLGLVLTKKIIELNGAAINYANPTENENVFELGFGLNT